jgi:transposase
VSQATAVPVSVIADTIVRMVELGVTITDAALDGETTVLFCDLLDRGRQLCPPRVWTGRCLPRHRRAAGHRHPDAGHLLVLRVRVRRYRCVTGACERVVFAADSSRLARPGATTTRRCARYVLRRLVLERTTVSAVARALCRSWDTVNTIAMQAAQDALAAARPARLDRLRVIGVDQHR